MIQGVNSAFSPDHSVLNFGSPAAAQLQYRRRRRSACAATLHRPVHESSFRASQEVYETARNRVEAPFNEVRCATNRPAAGSLIVSALPMITANNRLMSEMRCHDVITVIVLWTTNCASVNTIRDAILTCARKPTR